jgi:TatD DNase family protein
MKYTDAHCHLTKIPNGEIACCICDATNESEWDQVIENSNADTVFACIGVHPWFVSNINAGWESRLYEKLLQNQSVMVGEIGIDKYKPDIETQTKIFYDQFEIAAKLKRPIHLHCVGAWDKILHILKTASNNSLPTILVHGFNDNPQIIAQIAEKYNVYFSYSPHEITEKFSDIVRNTPIKRILTESDAYDSETAFQNIVMITETIAQILDSNPDDICEQIYDNFQRMVSYVRPIE